MSAAPHWWRHSERVIRGGQTLAPYAEAYGGSMNDPDAWMHAAAAIADILHALDALAAESVEFDAEYQGDAERVWRLALMHHEEERPTPAEEVTA